MRVHRLISILLLIESKGKIKAKELATKLETSVRTIYRDIDTLCEAGIPITTTTGPNGGIHFMEGFSAGISKLQKEDIVNLYLGSIGIKPDIQSDTGLKLQNALLKLEKNFPAKYNSDLQKAKERFYFDNSPWWGKHPKILCIDDLINGVWQSIKLKITYARNNHDVSNRIIHPYGIVVKRTDWYLVAYCENRKDIRTFRCERITSVEEIEEDFSTPIEFKLDEYWIRSENEFKSNCAEREIYLVKIEIHKSNSELMNKLEIVKLEEEDDYIIATTNMHSYEAACNEVVDIIGKVEILSPKMLRSFAKDKLNDIIKLYTK